MLAALLQTPESFFRSTCSVPANAKKFFEALAAFLQTPKSFSGHLQRSCKLQKVFRGTCSVSASSDFSFWAFAGVLQAPISPFGYLQKFCKLRFLLLGICRSSASSIFSFWTFAEVLQERKRGFWRLQYCCKRFQKHFGRYSAQSKTCSRDKIRDLILTPNSRLLSSDQPCFPHKEQEQIAEY